MADKALKEIVNLFHERDKGYNELDWKHALWGSQLDYVPVELPTFKEQAKLETEVMTVDPDISSYKNQEDPLPLTENYYIRVAFVKETFEDKNNTGISLLERYVIYYLVKTSYKEWKIYHVSNSDTPKTFFNRS